MRPQLAASWETLFRHAVDILDSVPAITRLDYSPTYDAAVRAVMEYLHRART